ncbi:catalase [Planomonospora venezuelensis]|uniref:Catalase n=1 Tax=Planomonospora venezuelensis TaxID=1999 RepID=A0A841DGQ4_PLAVE|nr:catalase [Planomonospora venezuelensis]MBB5966376.1 catalase [Planomonospora venezuelensis]GIN02797.1 catalase [Planomonospora venezuelensis]
MIGDGRTDKDRQLDDVRVDYRDTALTTDQGIRVDDTDNSLRPGERGPTLMEDFHFREKITHFDHERIPERVVHARGAAAHGYFEPYDDSLAAFTRAEFLTSPRTRTPVFVRFSTVAGSRGSADTVRDVRGFAVKFYTQQGNFDLVGNNMPVFFIQDGIKFPDFVHAVKPEPHNEIPQASSAHDTLWDFVQLQPETTHMMMWLMSDRALPRSYRMMQGFGVHTFRLVDAEGRGTFVKFHWKPKLGIHSLVWDETQKIAGKDPDFNRRDLWEAIETGNFPEWELGVQLVAEEDEHAFDFDLLDATKIIPEELVPVRPVGRLVLDRNPDNFFAETEQVAFHIGNVVPGIDFTNDPLLQGRLFSYLDTQLIRLGGPNFTQIPINRPLADVRNHHRDGYHQMTIPRGQASYHPNTTGGGCPAVGGPGAYTHFQERVDGHKIRKRSGSFADHYSQATLFWNSMSAWEKEHIVAAFRFELGKVVQTHIREGVVRNLNNVDHDLAALVAAGIGVAAPPAPAVPNHGRTSPALSQAHAPVQSAATRKVAVLVADGADAGQVEAVRAAITTMGAICDVLAPRGGAVRGEGGEAVPVTHALDTMASVLYDAVLVPGGQESARTLSVNGQAVHYVAEAFTHGKAVGALGAGSLLLEAARIGPGPHPGVVVGTTGDIDDFVEAFGTAVAAHRHPERAVDSVPA